MPNVYMVNEDGTYETKWVDNFRISKALAEGWSLERPAGQLTNLSLPIPGWPSQTPGFSDMKEIVGLLYIAFLTQNSRGGSRMNPYIIDIKESPTHSPTGNPRYLVTWSMFGREQRPSLTNQFGEPMVSPFANAVSSQGHMTDEITLYPDPDRQNQFRVTPTYQEPGVELMELREEALDLQNTAAAQRIIRSDRELTNIFRRMGSGRIDIWQGMSQIAAKVGWDGAGKLLQWSNFFVEAGLGLEPGFLPNLANYTWLQFPRYVQSLQEAIDPRALEGTALRPPGIFEGRAGPGVKDPRLVDRYTFDASEQHMYGTSADGEAPGLIPYPDGYENWSPQDQQAWLTNYLITQSQTQQYVAPDINSVRDTVRSKLVSLIGDSSPARVEILTQLYMDTHEAQSSRDPIQAVIDQIRLYPEYKRIHALRPAFIEEDTWLSYQFQGLLAGGMRTSAVQRRGITQAIAGGNPYNAAEDAQAFEYQETGRPLPAFLTGMRNTMQSIASMVY